MEQALIDSMAPSLTRGPVGADWRHELEADLYEEALGLQPLTLPYHTPTLYNHHANLSLSVCQLST